MNDFDQFEDIPAWQEGVVMVRCVFLTAWSWARRFGRAVMSFATLRSFTFVQDDRSRCVLALLLLAASAAGGEQARPMLKTSDIHIRDPFVLPVKSEGMYYLYGTVGGFDTFRSRDLKSWEGPLPAFRAPAGFWATRDYWAPEVHAYNGRYYMFASFKAEGVARGTQILVSDKPDGPFSPLTEKPVTPKNWECLDGTLYIDPRGEPWMVFCHEWVQVGDGEICAMRLSPDLKKGGKPVLLFKASEAKWAESVSKDRTAIVTDGPFLFRNAKGELLMLWSSFGKGMYRTGVARSTSGEITGPWIQSNESFDLQDAGHSMIFRTFDGKLMLSLHRPNGGGMERAVFLPVREANSTIELE